MTVSAAELEVSQAQEAVNSATLTAPISGTVATVGLTSGKDASTSSSITIIGTGAAQVTVDVPLSALPTLAVGQAAIITPAGGGGTVNGSVTQIGILPTNSTSSTPTYPVTITVDDPPQALAQDSQAQVAVTTKSVSNVVTVPASALTMVATGRATVQVVSGSDTVTTKSVTVGTVGGGKAQITGLDAGTQVVLGDLTATLGADGSSNENAFTGGGGFSGRSGMGGGGMPGGGSR
ncbi:hypothetical protein [Branchiibius sp. NY16-3462-2]|uniref:efflux RND transporter periplasmic adaptor subunit n=1 Tax=Branchiibius sp. NY16-3462-2 TaxID=1807500 RepID=UPI000797F9F7|nr:hypothetical protein [Branchiibius sp. NY16-3462-2]KYH44518.1 hypothetical protein AZH51_08425 [Branchiibius sp. NY16-3462-2]